MSETPSAPAGSPYLSEPVDVVTVTEYPADDFVGTADSPSTKEVAKEQIADVGHSVTGAGQHVTAVAKDQASNVAGEASAQAKNLLSQTRTELQQQAAGQQQRIAAGIRSLSEELGSMASTSQAGTASDLAGQAAARTESLAQWLEERDPGSLVSELTSFARRRPGTFLALAAGAGLVAGRLTRGAVAAAHDDTSVATTPAVAPVAPVETITAAPLPTSPGEPGYEAAYEPLEPWNGQVRA